MTETEKIQKYLNWPYSSLFSYLTRNGFTPKCAQRDRTHNLNKVTFMRSNKNGGHMKVTVWEPARCVMRNLPICWMNLEKKT